MIDIYSVSGCCSEDFCEYINFWKHNGYWLFNSPCVMQQIAIDISLDISDCTLFFYESYEKQFDQIKEIWRSYEPEQAFETNVIEPKSRSLEGFDVCCFSGGVDPECSPLSCGCLASKIPVNRHCLFDTFRAAFDAIENGQFANSEPGPLRIIAVYSVTP